MLKWKPEIITIDPKIKCMKSEHLVFFNSSSFHPCVLRKLPEAFGLEATKSWYPHNLNTEENLHYVGTMPDISYYGVDEMSGRERKEFPAWYEKQKSEQFDNMRVLEAYNQDNVTILRQACRVFRHEFLQI